MLGALAGDIIGSIYEVQNTKRYDFPLFGPGCEFTDDTVLTVATADKLLLNGDYVECYKSFFARYPMAGYGTHFIGWAMSKSREPYGSWGNGAAMRVSPIGFASATIEEALAEAERSASVTHNHPEGIKGAQATVACIFLARSGSTLPELREYVEREFGYDLSRSLEEIRPDYRFDVSCQGSVPVAIRAVLESTSYEDCIRKAISVGGDSDTITCIAGGIAHAYYGSVPQPIAERVFDFLDPYLAGITLEFCRNYGCL